MPGVTVRIPASTSNLGPGFDCLSVALRIYNHVTVRRGSQGRVDSMIGEAADAFFARAGLRPFAFSCETRGAVPVARGLGSSVTIRLGLAQGLNALAKRPLKREDIYELSAELEGHPDNAAAAGFGGFNIVRATSRQRFAVSTALKFVLLIPDFEVSTRKARALLPKNISHAAAVASCGNAAAITAAFASGKYENSQGAFRDFLHQPYRKTLVPFFDAVVAAAENAGALGAFLSGSGSTIAAITLRDPRRLAATMLSAAAASSSAAAGVNTLRCNIIVTTADNRGARVLPISNHRSAIRNSP